MTCPKKFLDEAYRIYSERILEVYDIAKYYYGEEHVDLQEFFTKEQFVDVIKFIRFGKLFTNPTDLPDGISVEDTIYEAMDITDDLSFLDNYTLDEEEIRWWLYESQGYYSIIYIWFPRVTITNESGHSTNIQDLYARVKVTSMGTSPDNFTMCRMTFTKEHFACGYVHSHLLTIRINNGYRFKEPCLGSGPIRNTLHELMDYEIEYDPLTWELFFVELSKYVTVESMQGGPYKTLDSIGVGVQEYKYNPQANFSSYMYKFYRYLLEHIDLTYKFVRGENMIAPRFEDFAVWTSNKYIEYLNSNPALRTTDNISLLIPVIKDGYVLKVQDTQRNTLADFSLFNDYPRFQFKGKDVPFVVLGDTEETTASTRLLSANIVSYLYKKINNYINVVAYGKSTKYPQIEKGGWLL